MALFHNDLSLNRHQTHQICINFLPPNDPKLSHGAKNCKREFAANLQMKDDIRQRVTFRQTEGAVGVGSGDLLGIILLVQSLR